MQWNKILQQQSSIPLVVENANAVNEDQNKNIENIESANFNTEVITNGQSSDQCEFCNVPLYPAKSITNLLD